MPLRTVILGAAGRDFHNFNVLYRNDPSVTVVAFTATQIPGMSGRRYPPALAGALSPHGIPIEDEADLEVICRREPIDQVVFAYSDVSHATVMHLASRALATGADFLLIGPKRTMLQLRRVAPTREMASGRSHDTVLTLSGPRRRRAAELSVPRQLMKLFISGSPRGAGFAHPASATSAERHNSLALCHC